MTEHEPTVVAAASLCRFSASCLRVGPPGLGLKRTVRRRALRARKLRWLLMENCKHETRSQGAVLPPGQPSTESNVTRQPVSESLLMHVNSADNLCAEPSSAGGKPNQRGKHLHLLFAGGGVARPDTSYGIQFRKECVDLRADLDLLCQTKTGNDRAALLCLEDVRTDEAVRQSRLDALEQALAVGIERVDAEGVLAEDEWNESEFPAVAKLSDWQMESFAQEHEGNSPIDTVVDAAVCLGNGATVSEIVFMAALSGIDVQLARKCVGRCIDKGMFRLEAGQAVFLTSDRRHGRLG
mmetsp:Transcript_37749/g.74922  ORF Transcript_37749/g.74922 Transcript_37749/m.74922 type:complete len:296 (-) Transcript_37749:66-953(-)